MLIFTRLLVIKAAVMVRVSPINPATNAIMPSIATKLLELLVEVGGGGCKLSVEVGVKLAAVGSSGIINAEIMYSMIPKPHTREIATHISLTTTGSMFKYSPNPPHTPAKTRFFLDLYSLLIDVDCSTFYSLFNT